MIFAVPFGIQRAQRRDELAQSSMQPHATFLSGSFHRASASDAKNLNTDA